MPWMIRQLWFALALLDLVPQLRFVIPKAVNAWKLRSTRVRPVTMEMSAQRVMNYIHQWAGRGKDGRGHKNVLVFWVAFLGGVRRASAPGSF